MPRALRQQSILSTTTIVSYYTQLAAVVSHRDMLHCVDWARYVNYSPAVTRRFSSSAVSAEFNFAVNTSHL